MNATKNRFAAIALLVAADAAHGDAVLDGSMGPTGTLSGTFEIPDDLGTQVGTNLFHSFSLFNVNAGESATFTSNFAGLTANVIARVTGNGLSTIDGALSSTVPGASLWIINPNGLVFGANAVLAVDGGFHASTADYLALADGGRFDATSLGDTVLTIANPIAFGFLGTSPAPITAGAAMLEVGEGQSLSLVGGDVSLTGTTVYAPNGAIAIGSAADSGTLSVALEPQGIERFGNVRASSAYVGTEGASGGVIRIRGGEFVLDAGGNVIANTFGPDAASRGGDILLDVASAAIVGGSQVSSTTFGGGNGGRIALAASGDVRIEGNVGGVPAGIFANVRQGATGNGGTVEIAANNLTVGQGGLIGAVTFGQGSAGSISLDVADTITIRRVAGFDGAIFLNSLPSATGGVGNITMDARRLVMTDNGQVQANTSNGPGGGVTINVDILEMTGGSQISTGTGGAGTGGTLTVNAREATLRGLTPAGFSTGLFANTFFPATGRGGDLVVNTRTLTVAGGAQLAAGASGSGPAGTITVNAAERALIDGEGLLFPLFTGIFANTFSNASAGSVRVTTPRLDVRQGGALRSGSFAQNPLGTGAGGNVTVDVVDLTLDAGFIEARTETSGRGGDVLVNASGTMTLRNSTGFVFTPGLGQPIGGVLTSAGGLFNSPVATGSAGNMTINAGTLLIRDGGVLSADTFLRGDAGTIVVNARTIDLLGSTSPLTGIFDTTSTAGRAGSIRLNANDVTIAGLASVTAATSAAGNAGAIGIEADRISIHSGGSVSSTTSSSGAGGEISLVSHDLLSVANAGRVSTGTTASGRGGNIVVSAPFIEISSNGVIAANATGSGNAGTVVATVADELDVIGGTITTSAALSAGGNIDLAVGRTLLVDGGTISAAAQGVTAQDSGGNITIDPEFVVLRGGTIVASANAGNGGNIAIQAGTFVLDTTSTIDASSTLGLDGEVAIDSPHEVTGEIIPPSPPVVGVDLLASQRCVPALYAQRSSLTAEPVGSVAAPAGYLSSPLPSAEAIASSVGEWPPLALAAAVSFETCYRVADEP